MFRFLSVLITKRPIKVIFITLILIGFMIVGVSQVFMATGNETLIDPGTRVFQENELFESEFGGESIIVMFEGDYPENLLSVENLRKLKDLEEKLQAYDDIYNIISPVTITEQITRKQADHFYEGMENMEKALAQASDKLTEIGTSIQRQADQQTNVNFNPDEFTSQLNQLDHAISSMIQGQSKLSKGMQQINSGYQSLGEQTMTVAAGLNQLTSQLKQQMNNSPDQPEGSRHQWQQMIQSLEDIYRKLTVLSENMTDTANRAESLQQIPVQTIQGLEKMEKGFHRQQKFLQQASDKEQLVNQLKDIAEGLITMGNQLDKLHNVIQQMINNRDVMYPGIPKKQETLDRILYDEKGQLRDIFNEVVVDSEHMMMIVRLNGNTPDDVKSEIAGFIQRKLTEEPLESVETTVTGKPVLDHAVQTEMQKSMQKMVVLAIVFMILVLSLIFKVQWRILSLPVIFVAVIATIGLMGWLSIPMTMVSMAVFPILIGLGVDYAIQFHNRYVEETEKGGHPHASK
ncbi:MAG: MMPL family transporter [Bacillaceae bacterium]|nr:MMPL family transporter [Bacillaceae bacterium]